MIISSIIALLGSSAFGSIIGGVFAILNRKADVEAKRLDLEHERARWGHEGLMRDKDLAIAQAEAAGRKEVAVIEGEAAMESARFGAIGQTAGAERVTADEIRAAGKWGFLLVWAAVFNKMIRPGLTVLLAGAALWLNWVMIRHMTDGWAGMTPTQQYEAGMQAFAWVTAQASTAFAYWFVSRGSGK
jgi:hypothetical protein